MKRISKKKAIIGGIIGGVAAGLITRKVVNSTIKYRKKKAEAIEAEAMEAEERLEVEPKMAVQSLGAYNIEYCDESTDDRYEYVNEDEITEEDLQSGLYEKCECVEIEEEEEVDTDEEAEIAEVNQLG